jgi:hypothetical protein
VVGWLRQSEIRTSNGTDTKGSGTMYWTNGVRTFLAFFFFIFIQQTAV